MAVTFRIHLNDIGFSAGVNQALVNLPSELAVTLPAGTGNLGEITLDQNGMLIVNSANPAVVATLVPLMPSNTVVADESGNVRLSGANIFTPVNLATQLANLNFPGASVVRDI